MKLFITNGIKHSLSLACLGWSLVFASESDELTHISHTISSKGVQDGASDLFSPGQKHCPSDKESPGEDKDDVADCTDLPRGGEKCELKLHSLFLMQQNRVEESIQKYREYVAKTDRYDFETLRNLAQVLLQKGIQSDDGQIVMMTLLGAGFSGSSCALEILEKGLKSPNPQLQLLALHFIAKIEDDRNSEIFNQAMSSDYLAIRMEAAYYMAITKHPHAVGQIESLMYRLPPVFKPYFPSLFALLGTSDATHTLKRLIDDPDPQTRVETILNVARLGRDDFLRILRKKLTHAHVAEVEASAFAIGALKDSHSRDRLLKLSSSPTDSIRLSASIALYGLGDRSHVSTIENLAKRSNLFAISALGEITETEDLLYELVESHDLQIRTNAAISLLKRRDPRVIDPLLEILITDTKDLAFHPFNSVGRTLHAIKAVPSAQIQSQDQKIDLSYSFAFKDHLLKEAAHLPEKAFLTLAEKIFQKGQNDLIPTTIALLENLRTEGAIQLLKKGSEILTFPLLRDYCNLALYRLQEEGPYEERVGLWVMNQKDAKMIEMRELLPWQYRMQEADYSLTPEETSRLLIDSFLSIASKRDEKSIAFLLEAIQKGNPINRYALMGLLMKATE